MTYFDDHIDFDLFLEYKAKTSVYCYSPLSSAELKGEKMKEGYFKVNIHDETTEVTWQTKEGPRASCFCVGIKVNDKYENECFSNTVIRLISMGYVHETGASDLFSKLLIANIGNEVLRKRLRTDITLPEGGHTMTYFDDPIGWFVECKANALKWRHPGQIPEIKKVIFNPPATIVMWEDGTKTVVKCRKGEEYSKEAGLAFCVMKKTYGGKFHRMFKDWCKESRWPEVEEYCDNDVKATEAAFHAYMEAKKKE